MVPFSVLRRTLTCPLCCLAISFTSASPSPAPPIARLRDLSTRKNGEKIFSWFSGEMPIPVSVTSIIIYRPFCKYICPLGAFYSIFNKVSVFRYRIDHDKCIHCGKCEKACQMEVNPVENPNSPECIRCGRCKKACPAQAIQCGVKRSWNYTRTGQFSF